MADGGALDEAAPAPAPGPAATQAWSPALRGLLGLSGVVLVIMGMRLAPDLIGPSLLAAILVIAVLPIGRWAMRRGWPTWAAGILTLVSGYLLLLLVVGGLALSITQLVAVLPKYGPRVTEISNELLKQLSDWGVDQSALQRAISKFDISSLVSVLQSVLGQVLHYLSMLFFVVALMLFLSFDALGLARRSSEIVAVSPRAARVLRDFIRGTQRYLVVSAVFGAIVAVLDTAALWILGVPLPLVWGLLSFLTNFVPNIGFVLGVIPPALLGLLEGGVSRMVWVLVVYVALNVVIQTFIQPRFVGDSVGINATTTFLALTFWGFALGPLGALLAIPATLFVRAVFVDEDPQARWLGILIGAPPPRAQTPDTSLIAE